MSVALPRSKTKCACGHVKAQHMMFNESIGCCGFVDTLCVGIKLPCKCRKFEGHILDGKEPSDAKSS